MKILEGQDTTKVIKESDGGFERITFKGEIYPRIEKEMLRQRYALNLQETRLDKSLREKGISNLLLIGINRYVCVYQTGLEAKDRNYNLLTCEELTNGKNCSHVEGEKWFKENTTNYKTLSELLQNL